MLETLEVEGVSVAIKTSWVGASTSVVELLELESNNFREFTNPPELFITKFLICRATLNRLSRLQLKGP